MKSFPLKEHSLMFAPMEGVTDEYYRNVIQNLYPEWDTLSCDFLRVPSTNPYPEKHLIKHFGETVYNTPPIRKKTIYQILTSPNAFTKETVKAISNLGIEWIDLNLGCPSKTVCKNQGGSYLLNHHDHLKEIIKEIRAHFTGTFTCKIRVGFNDDQNFIKTLKLLEDEGVDAIKIHGRTRDQLYKGTSNWNYIKQAVKTVHIPIIGNGDIWTLQDIDRFYDFTNCHSIMLARPALKTPWLGTLYKEKKADSLELRKKEIIRYFTTFYNETLKQDLPESSRIKRLKSVSRYIFEDLPNGEMIKRSFLLSKSFEEQMEHLQKNFK